MMPAPHASATGKDPVTQSSHGVMGQSPPQRRPRIEGRAVVWQAPEKVGLDREDGKGSRPVEPHGIVQQIAPEEGACASGLGQGAPGTRGAPVGAVH